VFDVFCLNFLRAELYFYMMNLIKANPEVRNNQNLRMAQKYLKPVDFF